MKKLKQKLKIKGSVLAFSLIIMGMMLVAALGLASVSSIERKTSSGSNKSNQSFQVADSGVEKVLSKIESASDLSDLFVSGSGLTCSTSKNITATVSGGTAEVELLDGAGEKIDCDSITEILADVRKIKSVGTYAGTTRAIEAAVAQVATPVGTCRDAGDQLYIKFSASCGGGWDQCELSELQRAAKLGCLPIAGQYIKNITGCATGFRLGQLEGLFGLDADGVWTTGGFFGGFPTSCPGSSDMACCRRN